MSTENKNTNNPLMVEQKKKHHLWGLWIPLIVIFAIVILPLGVAIILFYDSHHVDTGINSKQAESEIFSSMMTDMFDGCRNKEAPSIDLKLTQKQLNQLLYNASSELPAQASDYLKQFSVQIADDAYVFDLEISAFNLAKTHLILTTTVKAGADVGGGKIGFEFAITDMKVGRLGNLEGILPWMLNTVGIDLTDILSGAGLSIKFDVDNLRLTYAYDDFINDLSGKAGYTDPLFLNIFSNFFTEDLISFVHHKDADVTGSVSLTPFLANPSYTNSDYYISPVVEETPFLTYSSNNIQSMIDGGIIPNNSNVTENARTVLKFLTFGQDFLNNSEKSFVSSIYSNIQADYCQNLDMTAYSAYAKNLSVGDTECDIMNEITEAVNEKLADPSVYATYLTKVTTDGKAFLFGDDQDPFVVTDNKVHTMLKGNDALIGYGFTFVSNDDAGKAKVSYAVLDNFYPTIIPASSEVEGSKDTMALTFGLNINGAETSLVMPMAGAEVSNNNVHGLSFNMKDAPLYFGTETFPSLKDQLQDIINGISSKEGDMIQFVKDSAGNIAEIRMEFDFDDYFKNNPTSAFTTFHNVATQAPYNAKLIVDFDFVSSASDAPGKRAGQFNISVGYVKGSE